MYLLKKLDEHLKKEEIEKCQVCGDNDIDYDASDMCELNICESCLSSYNLAETEKYEEVLQKLYDGIDAGYYRNLGDIKLGIENALNL